MYKEDNAMLSYRALIEVTNNGPYVTKLILPMPVQIQAGRCDVRHVQRLR